MRKDSRVRWALPATLLLAAAVAGPAIASADSSGAPAQTSTAATFAQTQCRGGVTDGALFNWYGAPVVAGQAVVTSAAEANLPSGGGEFIGDAHVYTESVAVVDNAVLARVHTGWGLPLNVCVHYVG
ncbi:hypothetical protein [Amycolatopsis nigrescens]|uniref:hypothetical protein n=1 Tax=Amycolatopsis nigrescens TaxID=381445 RepID=UPI0012F94DD1|nr:hypothetical protein [Amycolatopsis nigrescens]